MRRGARSIYPQGRWDVAPSPRSAPRLLLIACTEATAGQTLRAGGGVSPATQPPKGAAKSAQKMRLTAAGRGTTIPAPFRLCCKVVGRTRLPFSGKLCVLPASIRFCRPKQSEGRFGMPKACARPIDPHQTVALLKTLPRFADLAARKSGGFGKGLLLCTARCPAPGSFVRWPSA